MHIITFSEAIREAMSEEMRRDPNVFLMGEDVGVFNGVWGVSNGMLAEFGPERIRDTAISEIAIIGSALGAAMSGMRPIAEIMFGDFLMCAGDQIVNQVAKARFMSGGKANVPLTIRVTSGAPGSAAAQHSQSPESWFMNIPGLKIVVPATPAD
ncbi:alpha-ketoacid dehydrogenase subunit beta, partial [bacterium]|nr:alpha-ketoacid dehydrogenase subunit beta [bacterium]